MTQVSLQQWLAMVLISLFSAPQIQPFPWALLLAEFVFVKDDAFKPPLAPLYRGPYRVLRWSDTFFVLQNGDKSDSVSVDRLKPVYSTVPVDPAVPPSQGRPWLVPPAVSIPSDPLRPLKKKICFSPLAPATQLRRNPCQTVQGSLPSSSLTFWGE